MLLHFRFYSIFSLLVPFLVAKDLAASQRTWAFASQPETKLDCFLRWVSGPSRVWAICTALVLVINASWVLKQPNLQPLEKITPSGAIAYIRSEKLSGHGLNFYNYGGYLIWSGISVFMDGRIDLRGEEGMKAYDNALTDVESTGLEQLLDENDIEWTLFPKVSIGVLHMDREPGWLRAYQDENAVIHVRKKF